MGTVQILTVYRCCGGSEEDEVESDGDGGNNPIVNQLPAIEKEKKEQSFATTIPCPG